MSNFRGVSEAVAEFKKDTGACEPIILAVDTSSQHGSLAISQGQQVLGILAAESAEKHSRTLLARIDTLLRLVKLEVRQLGALAVVSGPGSFTGLRVGLAAVKGLQRALELPAVGVTALESMAIAAGIAGRVVVVLEAGRGEVFAALREVYADGEVVALERDEVGLAGKILARWVKRWGSGPLIFVGDGAIRYRAEIAQLASEQGAELRCVRAAELGTDAWQLKLDLPYLAPAVAGRASQLLLSDRVVEPRAYYLRPSDAERTWSERGNQP